MSEHCGVHICESDGLLKFYIPMEDEAQDISIQHTLPCNLHKWIMAARTKKDITSSRHALGVIQSLLNAKISSVAQILDRHGIMDVSLPDTPPVEDDGPGGTSTLPGKQETPPESKMLPKEQSSYPKLAIRPHPSTPGSSTSPGSEPREQETPSKNAELSPSISSPARREEDVITEISTVPQQEIGDSLTEAGEDFGPGTLS